MKMTHSRLLPIAVATFVASVALTVAGQTPATSDAGEAPPGPGRVAQATITAGEGHTCALFDGRVWCWGANDLGQLGNGTSVDALDPVPVLGLTGVTAIAAGAHHTCAVLGDATARCWGSGADGQLGNGFAATSTVPVPVAGLTGVTMIAGGMWHTCALAGGAAKCWGRGANGQLGNNSGASSAVPVSVLGLAAPTTITAGNAHSCATQADGTAWCWGFHGSGQLGNPNIPLTVQPTPTGVVGLTSATAITGGGNHTCAIAAGAPRCWGWNFYGQIGNGMRFDNPPAHTGVLGLGAVSSISGGTTHTCASLADGSLRCWGDNTSGQLGFQTDATSVSTVPGAVIGLGGVALAVTTGGEHSCALRADRAVRCWGLNNRGQLGSGDTVAWMSPVTALALPSAPAGVSARPGTGAATVSFTASSGRPAVASYRVVASPGGQVATGTGSPITVSGLTNGTAYTFKVTAISPLGESVESAASNSVTPSTLPFYAINDVSVSEGNAASKNVTFTITRFGNTAASSTVKYATANGTATAPTDFTAKAPTYTSFAAGQTSKSATVTLKGDVIAEGDETFLVVLSAPVRASIFDGTGVGTILNDDSDAPPSFSVNDATVTEGDSGTRNATFTITRSGSAAGTVSVKYRTFGISADAPSDYYAKSLTSLSFFNGQVSKTVSVVVRGDVVDESDELFVLELVSATGATITRNAGLGTIVDDDPD